MTLICQEIGRYCFEEQTNRYNKVARIMIETYEEAVLDYGRGGLAFTAALLITSPVTANHLDGLYLLRRMTEVNSKIVAFLLPNEEIE